MANYARAFGVAVLVAASTAIVFPIVFGVPATFKDREGGDLWWNFVYDFQPLIAGVIAVAAAYLTVQQMRITDDKADQRHEESRRLIQWANTLKVERLLYPQLGELEEDLRGLSWVDLPEPPTRGYATAEYWAHIREIVGSIQLRAMNVARVMKRQAFTEAAELFDGRLMSDIEALERSASEVELSTGRILGYFRYLEAAKGPDSIEKMIWYSDRDEADADLNARLLPSSTVKMILDLEKMVAGLRRLASVYRIVI